MTNTSIQTPKFSGVVPHDKVKVYVVATLPLIGLTNSLVFFVRDDICSFIEGTYKVKEWVT